jgi:hypothetical protein
MTSITALSTDELLTQAMEFVTQALADCGFVVCAQQRTFTEPRTIQCCDGCAETYALYAWVVRTFPSDWQLNEIQSANCPSLDATVMGFTIARCWPESSTVPKSGGPMDATSVELMRVMDCIRAALGSCESRPELFHGTGEDETPMRCIRLQTSGFLPEKNSVVTPYGEDGGKVTSWCAGWKWSITVA